MMKNESSSRQAAGAFGLLTIIWLSLLPLCGASLLIQDGISMKRWKDIREAFNSYSNDPSPLHGKELVSLLPAERVIVNEEDGAFKEYLSTLELIFSSKDSDPFMMRVQNGDKYAIEAALRIFNISDAGNAESIMIILGDALRDHARTTLAVLNKYQGLLRSEDLLAPAVTTRYDVDSEEEMRELRLRLEALKNVDEPKLLVLKNACINEILKKLRVGTFIHLLI